MKTMRVLFLCVCAALSATANAGGVLNVLLAMTTASSGNLVVGVSGVTAGYASDLSLGSLTPSIKLWRAAPTSTTIQRAYSNNIADFVIGSTTASGAQNIFQYVDVQDGTGVVRRYTSASATFTAVGVLTWSWGDGTNRVYSSGDSGESHIMTVVY